MLPRWRSTVFSLTKSFSAIKVTISRSRRVSRSFGAPTVLAAPEEVAHERRDRFRIQELAAVHRRPAGLDQDGILIGLRRRGDIAVGAAEVGRTMIAEPYDDAAPRVSERDALLEHDRVRPVSRSAMPPNTLDVMRAVAARAPIEAGSQIMHLQSRRSCDHDALTDAGPGACFQALVSNSATTISAPANFRIRLRVAPQLRHDLAPQCGDGLSTRAV
jgi:hypothetical protein